MEGADGSRRDTFEMDIEDDKGRAEPSVDRWGESSRDIDDERPYDGQWERPVRRQYNIRERIQRLMDRRELYEFAKRWKWIIAIVALYFVIGAIMVHYRRQLLEGLEKLSNAVQDMGISGYLLLSILIFLSAFPPLIGYGLYQTLSGFAFGFVRGFLVSYLSALLGAVACFYVSRVWLQARIQRLLQNYPNLEAVIHAVEKKGFRLFLLIRLSPYPFNLMNVMFAATNLSLATFAAGTALSLFKIALHIYIGANLTSFAKHILGEEEMTEGEQRAETVRIVAAVLGSILAFGVMAYLYRTAKKAIAEANSEAAEAAESMAFLGEEAQEVESLEDWTEWRDDDDNSMDHTQNVSNDLERGRP